MSRRPQIEKLYEVSMSEICLEEGNREAESIISLSFLDQGNNISEKEEVIAGN